MPLYEYECEACRHRTEVLQTFAEDRMTICAECGGPLRRLISAPGIHFKGSGWYVSDYARKGSTGAAASADSAKPASSGSESTSDTKSDAKVESKSESKPDSSSSSSSSSSGSEKKAE